MEKLRTLLEQQIHFDYKGNWEQTVVIKRVECIIKIQTHKAGLVSAVCSKSRLAFRSSLVRFPVVAHSF